MKNHAWYGLTQSLNPNLSPTNCTTMATNNPVTNFWTFTDTNAMTTVPQCFYRAFITTP